MPQPPTPSVPPRFCNYEGSDYRTAFWEGQGREYEDLAERIALRRLIPPKGGRLIDIGAGFGRLVDLYAGYQEIVLLDPSRSLLEEARQRLQQQNVIYVAANVYSMPFAAPSFDTAVMVRVLHHLSDVPLALRAIHHILRPAGTLLLEYANKRNLKAIARYVLRQQTENPFTTVPWEFQPLHFDFHPAYVTEQLRRAGFSPNRTLAVSHFRLRLLKQLVPANRLATFDGWLQPITAPLALTPSIFTSSLKTGKATSLAEPLFRCPRCKSAKLVPEFDLLICIECGCRWATNGGIYDFRQPLDESAASPARSLP